MGTEYYTTISITLISHKLKILRTNFFFSSIVVVSFHNTLKVYNTDSKSNGINCLLLIPGAVVVSWRTSSHNMMYLELFTNDNYNFCWNFCCLHSIHIAENNQKSRQYTLSKCMRFSMRVMISIHELCMLQAMSTNIFYRLTIFGLKNPINR